MNTFLHLTLLLSSFLIIFFQSPALTQANDDAEPLSKGSSLEISYYEELLPMKLQARSSEEPSTADTWTWSFEAFGRAFSVILESNTRLIARLPHAQQEKLSSSDVHLFRGTVESIEGSWVRLTQTGNNWSGMIWDGEELYIIDPMNIMAPSLATPPASVGSQQGIYRLSDTRSSDVQTCGLGTLPGVPNSPIRKYNDLIGELQSLVPAKAEGAALNLDMAVVVDQDFVQQQENDFGTSADAAVIARMNVVDGIYSEQVDVQISLVEIREIGQNGPISGTTNPSALLNDFGDFTNSSAFDHPGIAHLFTGRNLSGSTVGIAYLSSICSDRFGVGVNEIRGGGTSRALVVAHELGHNFGAPHDNQGGSPCASTPGTFIMNPSINGSDQFSNCSLNQMQPEIQNASCITVIDISRADVRANILTNSIQADTGDSFDYSVEVQNVGNGTANNVIGIVRVPEGLEVLSARGGNENCSVNSRGKVFCELNNLPGGQESTIRVSIRGQSAGQFTVRAEARASNDDNPQNNDDQSTVTISGGPTGGGIVFENHFDGEGSEEFGYVDDAFRNTNEPAFASGSHEPRQGFSGGALRVNIGGINNNRVLNMSGGWKRRFPMGSTASVTLTFRYKLTQTATYESDERSQALLAVDNVMIGNGNDDFLAEIRGDGTGGNPITTDWVNASIPLGTLTPGNHSIVIGGYNNKKTSSNESTEILIDDIVLRRN